MTHDMMGRGEKFHLFPTPAFISHVTICHTAHVHQPRGIFCNSWHLQLKQQICSSVHHGLAKLQLQYITNERNIFLKNPGGRPKVNLLVCVLYLSDLKPKTPSQPTFITLYQPKTPLYLKAPRQLAPTTVTYDTKAYIVL
ncbi:hypothetical protein CEXT_453291 [Caerostris extrusa]|uniref:Uncharacterized protein n=1 Tax=Caerostris extrusa TaxID=172846 RepID=A0AAV4MSH2_CAEEX|nr:hypothetical protein CEXT_453291 [Caerostris extrusa]